MSRAVRNIWNACAPLGHRSPWRARGLFGQRGRRPAIGGRRRAGNGESRVSQKLEEYFQELALQKNTVPYNRVAFLLLSIPGVDNFTALSLNQGEADLTIPSGSVPVLGEADIS